MTRLKEITMSFINYVEFADGSPDVQRVYGKYGGANGRPVNIIRVSGVNPPVLEQHVSLYRSITYGGSPLSRQQREMIAVVVSALNQCHY